MGTPIVSCRGVPGSGSRCWWFCTIFHGFSLGKMFFQPLRTYIDAKFHGESISDGFRAIRERKVDQKLKNPKKSRQTRFSGHHPRNSLSIYPASDCRLARGARPALGQVFRGQRRGYGDRWVALTQLTGACYYDDAQLKIPKFHTRDIVCCLNASVLGQWDRSPGAGSAA